MRFRRKVTVLVLLLELGVVLLLAGLTYPRLYAEQKENLRRFVTGIASTAALSIDGDLHALIPPEPSSASLPAHQQLQTRLKQILSANPGIRYVWTMVPGRRPGQTLFVGDVGGGKQQAPGRPYNAAAIPDLWEGFKVPTADRKEVKDPWGISLSGYAPIRNREGLVVAVLGVDVYGQELYRLRQSLVRFLLVSFPVVLVLGLLGGALVGRIIARPLSHLVAGMRKVEGGNLDQRVEIFTGDEFQQAAAAFNRMTTGLQSARAELRAAFLKTIQSLMSALEAKDPYTRGHSVSVADAYDAMTSHRPYRHAMPPAQALAELRRGAGTQFRPEVVEALVIVLEKKGLV